MLSESKDYNPFKDYDINKFILTLSQMNNIKHNPDLYKKYNNFLSLKKKQDKIQFDTLLKNILLIFNNLTKKKYLQTAFFSKKGNCYIFCINQDCVLYYSFETKLI